MGKATEVSRAITPAKLTEWRRETLDRVTVIVLENHVEQMDEQAKMKTLTGQLIFQVEELRKEVAALQAAALHSQAVGA